ncbi:glycosyltransferase family 2 protein [Sulfitobacter sp. PM12]|uniref:glycosyltransferase family 2 protein n=1 Tax=Sulfitobacter sp. PM12 TaxID=3138497 RepID=UPI003890286F
MTANLKFISERQLVTFALFSYNQENYIREAIKGAFSQTYEPLEIILSDDCSNDGTFKIMQEMAAEYEGPHKVQVRQSCENRRLMGHINDVVSLAQGDIIVMAAGDDISLPERTAEHLTIYNRWPETYAVCSDFFPMSEPFAPFRKQRQQAVREYTLLHHMNNVGGVGCGATYSYRRKCFTWPAFVPECIEMEDRVLPTRAALLGRVAFHKGRLVRYRTPGETGQLEVKRRWLRSKALKPIVTHLRENLRTARANKRLGMLSEFGALLALYIGYQKVTVANKNSSRQGKFLRKIFANFIGMPSAFILRIKRLTDFYSPILKRVGR